MKIIKLGEQLNSSIALAIGYFDAIHLGHLKLINKTKDLAKKHNVLSTVLIFTGGKKGRVNVYSFEERVEILKKLDIDVCIYADLNENLMNVDKNSFLKYIFSIYNISSIVCGFDFRFGKGALGDYKDINKFCENIDVENYVIEKVTTSDGTKISTTLIKELVESGKVEEANKYLSFDYIILGKIVYGRQIGRTIGFPTANMIPDPKKIMVRPGVYKSYAIVDGVKYNSITNIGPQPTVEGEDYVIETHLLNFNGNLYDRVISIHMVRYLRDIVKFESLDKLKEQLQKDSLC